MSDKYERYNNAAGDHLQARLRDFFVFLLEFLFFPDYITMMPVIGT